MELNRFELEVVKAIGKHQPPLLEIISELKVKKRELTGSGLYVDFEPIKNEITWHVSLLDLYGLIKMPNGLVLSAHIETNNKKPEFLEIVTLPLTDWDGGYEGFTIEN